MLANDRRSFDFGTIIIVCAAKFDALNPFGYWAVRWCMLLTQHFTFPLPVKTPVSPDVVYVRVAAVNLAVMQNQYAASVHACPIGG
jgi:hypothetical protein